MTYSFTLVLSDVTDLNETQVQRLFAAGCDDCTPSVCAAVACLDFDREAPTAKAAVDRAIRQVQAAGLGVQRIEPDDLVTQAEIARRLKRSRASVGLLIHGQRGPGSFPKPVHAVTSTSPLWSWAAAAEWAAKHGMLDAAAASWARLVSETNRRLSFPEGVVTVRARQVGSAQPRSRSACRRHNASRKPVSA